MSEKDRAASSSCIYCGQPAHGALTCSAHRDLEAVDPELALERQAGEDAEVSAAQPSSVQRRRRRRGK